MIVAPGATSVTLTVQIVDDSGSGVTGLAAAAWPATYYQRAGESLPAAITLSDLAAQNSAYSSGGVKELTGGYYRLDVPDAAFATASRVRVIGEASGKHVIYPVITCAYVQGDVEQWKGATAPANTGDAYARLGAPAGASVSADVLAVSTRVTTALPNVAPAASGGLPTVGTGTGQLNPSGGKLAATLASTDVTGNLPADAKAINAVSTASVTAVRANLGTAEPINFTGTSTSALVKTDLIDITGVAVTDGVAPVNVTQWNGTNVATPATAGVPEVNVARVNNVATTSVAAVKANLGTDQPVNFTGTSTSALAKVDVVDFGGTAGTFASGTPSVNLAANAVTDAAIAADSGLKALHQNVAQGGASSAVILHSTASTTPQFYRGAIVYPIAGTGAGQAPRLITDYTAGRLATVAPPWAVAPDNTSRMVVAARGPADLQAVGSDAAAAAGLKSEGTDYAAGALTATTVLAATQPNYAPSKAGDAMTLTSGERTTVAATVWDLPTSGHTTAGSFGNAMQAAGSAGDPWATVLSGYASGTAGYTVAHYLDAQVSLVKAKTDNLPATPAAVGSAMTIQAGSLTSSAFAAGAITSSVIAAAALNGKGDWSTAANVASVPAGVWDLNVTGHNTAGSFGNALLAASAAGDPWLSSTTGLGYTAGTFGYAVGHNLDATVSSRSTLAAGSAMALVDGAITDAKFIAPVEAAGRPTGPLGWLRRVFEWHANKRTRDRTTGQLSLRDANDGFNLETQTQSTTGSVDTQSKGV